MLFDYAPDVANYTSDVTRMFPANGRFTPWQREIYTVYLRCYRALMAELKPGRTPRQVHDAAFVTMRQIVDGTTFADPKVAQAARNFIALFGPERRAVRVGHWVGMEVHDVDAEPEGDVLQPGMVLHDRTGADHPGGSRLHPARGRHRDHRGRLREPVRVAALRDRRHRSGDGRAGPRRGVAAGDRAASVEAIDPSVHHHTPTPAAPDDSHDDHHPHRCPPSRSPRSSPPRPWRNPPSRRPRPPSGNASR